MVEVKEWATDQDVLTLADDAVLTKQQVRAPPTPLVSWQ